GRRVALATRIISTRATRVRPYRSRSCWRTWGSAWPGRYRCTLAESLRLFPIQCRTLRLGCRHIAIIRRYNATRTHAVGHVALLRETTLRHLTRGCHRRPYLARRCGLQIRSASAIVDVAGGIRIAVIVSCSTVTIVGIATRVFGTIVYNLRIVPTMYDYRRAPVRMIDGMRIHDPRRRANRVISVVRNPVRVVVIIIYGSPG